MALLEGELAAVTAELQRTKRMVPTPALLHQLAKATRSMQANHAAHNIATQQQQQAAVIAGKENSQPKGSASSEPPPSTPVVPVIRRIS